MINCILHIGIVFLGAYGLASIPFGLLIARVMGLGDIRGIGSGNIGATNVLRTGSKIATALTLIFDIGKGGVAVMAAAFITREPVLVAIAATAAVIGHCYPVWLRFKGGKGVATGIGVMLALNLLAGGAMIATWLLSAGLFRLSSLAAVIAYLTAPIWVYTLAADAEQIPYTITAGVIAVLSLWRHRSNIRRLFQGSEPKIGQKHKK